MTKRRVVVRFLIDSGFVLLGGTEHEKFGDGETVIFVKRHREIDDAAFGKIERAVGKR